MKRRINSKINLLYNFNMEEFCKAKKLTLCEIIKSLVTWGVTNQDMLFLDNYKWLEVIVKDR